MLTDEEIHAAELGMKILDATVTKCRLTTHHASVVLAGTILSVAMESGSTIDELQAGMSHFMERARKEAEAMQAQASNVVPLHPE